MRQLLKYLFTTDVMSTDNMKKELLEKGTASKLTHHTKNRPNIVVVFEKLQQQQSETSHISLLSVIVTVHINFKTAKLFHDSFHLPYKYFFCSVYTVIFFSFFN